ncbi:glutamate 5-kinase [Cyanobacterium sp. uoEpiScrs1]|uniref:glutamate 5-kinase n=1 Tax=Cyanobacterium sp. uoEpiScrs1 TaxID=2976343 RepID=UPI002269AF9D|nr:glutamate 5-kinase [Cyanobacterium sp. uoEpiScrs1]
MKQTLVVKVGTSSLTQSSSGQLALSTIATLVETLTQLQQLGYRVVLVSSGAVGVGCVRLNLKERPKKIAFKQAIAAVGQGRLIRIYDDLFTTIGQPIAQVLLTRRELIERSCYVNAHNTFRSLFELGVIPIVNENDTVATEELKFGDNDTLSALLASVIRADWLFLLTDVDQLYSADPRLVQDAQPITLVNAKEIDLLKVNAGNKGSQWGTGGMATKLMAARLATSAGVRTVITHGKNPGNLLKILEGKAIGTQFEPQLRNENARKRWIAYGLVPSGQLYLDQGAVQAICHQGKSLLAVGIIKVKGHFEASDAIQLYDEQGQELARGIVNYSSLEIKKIKGHHSDKFADILGYEGPSTMIHRDNLVIQDSRKLNKFDINSQ